MHFRKQSVFLVTGSESSPTSFAHDASRLSQSLHHQPPMKSHAKELRQASSRAMAQHRAACARTTIVGDAPRMSAPSADALMGISEQTVLCLDHSMTQSTYDKPAWLQAIGKANLAVLDLTSARRLTGRRTAVSTAKALTLATSTPVVVATRRYLVLASPGSEPVEIQVAEHLPTGRRSTALDLMLAAVMITAMNDSGLRLDQALWAAAAMLSDRGQFPGSVDQVRSMTRSHQLRIARTKIRRNKEIKHAIAVVATIVILVTAVALMTPTLLAQSAALATAVSAMPITATV